jgi:hypothetical protein
MEDDANLQPSPQHSPRHGVKRSRRRSKRQKSDQSSSSATNDVPGATAVNQQSHTLVSNTEPRPAPSSLHSLRVASVRVPPNVETLIKIITAIMAKRTKGTFTDQEEGVRDVALCEARTYLGLAHSLREENALIDTLFGSLRKAARYFPQLRKQDVIHVLEDEKIQLAALQSPTSAN